MIVVSDTTPLNYLVLIDAIDVLPALFTDVYVPPDVLAELADSRAPEPVRNWASGPPPWLKQQSPSSRLPSTAALDPGEAAAISLAKEIRAAAILVDEKRGVRVAREEGLVIVRTLAVLELAGERRLIDLREALKRLKATTFRISQDVLTKLLARHVDRS